AVHYSMRRRDAAPNISSAKYDRHLDTEIANIPYPFGDFTHDTQRNILASTALLECFAAQLEHNAFISWRFRLHSRANQNRRGGFLESKMLLPESICRVQNRRV